MTCMSFWPRADIKAIRPWNETRNRKKEFLGFFFLSQTRILFHFLNSNKKFFFQLRKKLDCPGWTPRAWVYPMQVQAVAKQHLDEEYPWQAGLFLNLKRLEALCHFGRSVKADEHHQSFLLNSEIKKIRQSLLTFRLSFNSEKFDGSVYVSEIGILKHLILTFCTGKKRLKRHLTVFL